MESRLTLNLSDLPQGLWSNTLLFSVLSRRSHGRSRLREALGPSLRALQRPYLDGLGSPCIDDRRHDFP